MTSDLVQYIVDLEDLVRWFARSYFYTELVDGEMVTRWNEPIWQFNDQYGQDLVDNKRLARTWAIVVHGQQMEDSNGRQGS